MPVPFFSLYPHQAGNLRLQYVTCILLPYGMDRQMLFLPELPGGHVHDGNFIGKKGFHQSLVIITDNGYFYIGTGFFKITDQFT